MHDDDSGNDLVAQWVAFFQESPRLSRDILGTFDATGNLADLDGYHRVVVEMGAAGHTTAVLLTWARVLAHTHPAGADVLAPYIPTIPDEHWRTPVHRHGRALINTVRAATANPDGPLMMVDQAGRASDALGNDIWHLIWVMAAATYPVQRELGGLDRFGEIQDLVTAGAADLGPGFARAIPSVSAGLAAINTGYHDRARSCLGLLQVFPDLIAVLTAVAGHVLRGRRTGPVISLDEAGVPDSIGEADTIAMTLTQDLLTAVISRDGDRLTTVYKAIAATSQGDQIQVSWHLALTIGHHLT